MIRVNSKTALGKIVNEMKKDCETAVIEAIRTSEFVSKSGNLIDSYGAALYLDGELIYDSIFYLEPTAATTKSWYERSGVSGHEEMLNYFNKFRPRKAGLTMVLVAAMPYGPILESGRGNGLTRKYKVIVGANSVMRKIAEKYSGMFGRRRGGRTSVNVERITE